jgi:hypothetical protein
MTRTSSRRAPFKLAGLCGLGLCLGLTTRPAAAAGFDGRWIADIPAQNRCNFTGTMTLIVSGNDISGQVDNPPGINVPVAHFTGRLDDSGFGNFVVNRRYAGTMTFKGDRFEATWNNGNCDRHAEGERAPAPEQLAALAEARRQHQEAYAALVAQAEAGQAVDWGKLRAESVYAADWDFYDGKVNGLLQQADAAVKGKDCGQALAILDQVIRADFIVDSAHALEADCLKKTGQPDKARVEDAIAKGLVHSLMDGFSGPHGLLGPPGGGTEESAYVVHSLREEMDVLANRHIQLKTRQTQIRGSNGHYYDLIQGVEIEAMGQAARVGPYLVARRGNVATPRSVYFDITSFVTGRASRRAAAQVAASQIQ